jgi:hypothetical protein
MNGYEDKVSNNRGKPKHINLTKYGHSFTSHPNNFPGHFTHRNVSHINKSDDFVYNKNDFPPLHGLPKSNIDELTTAMKQMQTCMEQFVHCAIPKRTDHGMTQNEQHTMHYSNGYQEQHPVIPNQHLAFRNHERQYNEAKNYEIANQGFLQ